MCSCDSPDISCPINFAFDVKVVKSIDSSSTDGSGGGGSTGDDGANRNSASDGYVHDDSASRGSASGGDKQPSHTKKMCLYFLSLSTASTLDINVVDKCIFAACDKRSCVNVTIIDEGNKSFNVTLEKTPDLDSKITLDSLVGLVEIRENKGKY